MQKLQHHIFQKGEFVSMKNPKPETLGQIIFIQGRFAKLEFIFKGKKQTRLELVSDLKPLPKKQTKEENI